MGLQALYQVFVDVAMAHVNCPVARGFLGLVDGFGMPPRRVLERQTYFVGSAPVQYRVGTDLGMSLNPPVL